MNNQLKLIIFDCDGTLVDSQHMIVAAMHRAYEIHDIPVPSRERLLSIIGLSLPSAFAFLGDGDPTYPIESLVAGYRAAFFELREANPQVEPLFPGAREAIDILTARPGVKLGIATGKSQRGVRLVLGRHGLLDRFETIKTSDDAPSKPHPSMVIEAMRDIGANPADTIVIGDTAYDMTMARAAGTAGIGVAWGYHPPQALHDAGAYAVIEDFPALIPALDTLWESTANA